MNTKKSITFSDLVKKSRTDMGISLKDLSEKISHKSQNGIGGINMPRQRLSELERGEFQIENEYHVIRIAEELGISSDYALYLEGKIPPDVRRIDCDPEKLEEAMSMLRGV